MYTVGGIRETGGSWRTERGGRLCFKAGIVTRGRELCQRLVVQGESVVALGDDGAPNPKLLVEIPYGHAIPKVVQKAMSRAR